jgi:lambda repressor-like predicted transcriptional regulator
MGLREAADKAGVTYNVLAGAGIKVDVNRTRAIKSEKRAAETAIIARRVTAAKKAGTSIVDYAREKGISPNRLWEYGKRSQRPKASTVIGKPGTRPPGASS